jgi:hypothetical protein
MPTARTVNEKSPLHMTVGFKDEDGNPLVPTTAEWRLDDRETDTQIVDWTNMPTPAASMAVVIPGAEHVIVDEDKVREKRTFGIRANGGLAAEAFQEYHYHVLNIYGTSGA